MTDALAWLDSALMRAHHELRVVSAVAGTRTTAQLSFELTDALNALEAVHKASTTPCTGCQHPERSA